jgi:nucleotide-binding universal stress UspA family protein
MGYKTILVHLDAGSAMTGRAEIAARLAQQHGAHLVGLHALTVTPVPSFALADSANLIREAHGKALAELRTKAEAAFNEGVKRVGVDSREWRMSTMDAAQAVPIHARHADLVVIAQAGTNDSGVAPDFPDRVILSSGRPVLLLPFAGKFGLPGKRVLVAWSASRESTRALTDALPQLKLAERVDVVAFNPDGASHGEEPGADIGLYLARHGVKVNVAHQRSKEVDVAGQILSRLADAGADLLVMGGYGHSRIREIVMGGVTREILHSMTVPVLMSH